MGTAAGSRDQIRSEALFSEDETPELIAQFLDFLRIFRRSEAFGQFEEGLFLLLTSLDALLDEFHQDAVIAKTTLFRNGGDLPVDFWRQRDASTNEFRGST
jgi:hypothetical protein